MKKSVTQKDADSRPSPRIVYWDVVKCLLMYLVILGHGVQFLRHGSISSNFFWEDSVFKAIYMFHMPCFILISGYFAEKIIQEKPWKTLPKYARRLLLPGITFGCFGLLYKMTRGEVDVLSIQLIVKFACSFWFLIVLFECVCFYSLLSLLKSKIFRTVMIIFPMILALGITQLPHNLQLFPYNEWFVYYWPFFLLGVAMRHYCISPEKIKNAFLWGVVFLVMYVIAFLFFPHQWTVYQKAPELSIESLFINGIRTLVAVIGCGAFLLVVRAVTFIGKYSIVRLLGAATMGLYVLQSCVFSVRSLYMPYLPKYMGYGWLCVLSLVLMLFLFAAYVLTSQIKWARLMMYGERR